MIIPVRCYTCGEVLADKWIPYISAVQTEKNNSTENINSDTSESLNNSIEQIEEAIMICFWIGLGTGFAVAYLVLYYYINNE